MVQSTLICSHFQLPSLLILAPLISRPFRATPLVHLVIVPTWYLSQFTYNLLFLYTLVTRKCRLCLPTRPPYPRYSPWFFFIRFYPILVFHGNSLYSSKGSIPFREITCFPSTSNYTPFFTKGRPLKPPVIIIILFLLRWKIDFSKFQELNLIL